MSETLYNVDYYKSLFDLVDHCLDRNGFVLVGTKTFYFGLGGGQFELEKYLRERYAELHLTLVTEVLLKINDLKSIERVILRLCYQNSYTEMQVDENNDFQLQF